MKINSVVEDLVKSSKEHSEPTKWVEPEFYSYVPPAQDVESAVVAYSITVVELLANGNSRTTKANVAASEIG